MSEKDKIQKSQDPYPLVKPLKTVKESQPIPKNNPPLPKQKSSDSDRQSGGSEK